MPVQYILFIAFHNSQFLILLNFKVGGKYTKNIYLNFLLNVNSCSIFINIVMNLALQFYCKKQNLFLNPKYGRYLLFSYPPVVT